MRKGMGFGRNEIQQFLTILPIIVIVVFMMPITFLFHLQPKMAEQRDKSAYITIALVSVVSWQILAAGAWSMATPLSTCAILGLIGAAVMTLGVLTDRRFLVIGNGFKWLENPLPYHALNWDEITSILKAPFSAASLQLWMLRMREWKRTWVGSLLYFVFATTFVDWLAATSQHTL